MPIEKENLVSIAEAKDKELHNSTVFLKVAKSGYHDISEGLIKVLDVTVENEEYIAKDSKGVVMVATDGDNIIVHQLSTNPYERAFAKEFSLNNLEKKEEFLQALAMVSFKLVSFGGEQPYLRLLREIYLAIEEPEVPTEPDSGDGET